MEMSFGSATLAATCIALKRPDSTAQPAQQPDSPWRAAVIITPSKPAAISSYPSIVLSASSCATPAIFWQSVVIASVTLWSSGESAITSVVKPQTPAAILALHFTVAPPVRIPHYILPQAAPERLLPLR